MSQLQYYKEQSDKRANIYGKTEWSIGGGKDKLAGKSGNKIMCIELDKTFDNCIDAAIWIKYYLKCREHYVTLAKMIVNTAGGYQKKAKNLHWRYIK